jgi:hypothetical protein
MVILISKKENLMRLKLCFAAVLVSFIASNAVAQNPAPTPPLSNIYAVGTSWSPGAQPAVAGTGLYAHIISDGTGTYAFTVVDALPISVKPFTVSTSIGAGIAQKVFTIGKVNFYIPTAAGISYSGTNTGWAWSTGGIAAIPLKNNVFLMPTVRVQKSSVSNGAGYQPIVGLLIGWGK